MPPPSRRAWLLAGLLPLAVSSADSLAQAPGAPSPPPAPAGTSPTSASSDQEPVYQPPMRGAPAGRIAGGSRGPARDVDGGEARESLLLVALAPDQTGLTIASQPVLYWFISRPTARQIRFSLVEMHATRALVEQRIAGPATPGIQRVALADLGTRLEIGKSYVWSVALVVDPGSRSPDITATTTVERIAEPVSLTPEDRTRPQALAQAGLWYDAFHALSSRIAANPADARLRTFRASLLDQIGLAAVARHERANAR